MKRAFALLFFLILPLTPLGAQGLHGKILLLRDSLMFGPDSLQNAIVLNYRGHVDSEFSLPSDLSQYDAIFMEVHSTEFHSADTLSIQDQVRIIDYLKKGGKVYAEGDFFEKNNFPLNDTASDPEDTLWHFLGLTSEFGDEVVDYYDTIIGVDSEFTHGFRIPQGYESAFELSTYRPNGRINPVLLAPESPGDYLFDVLAWVPADRLLIAVMHHPIPGNYYNSFLALVLCDYFGLCTDAVQEQKPIPSKDLRVVEDGDEMWLVAANKYESELDIVNTLGESVFHQFINAGGEKIAIPANIPSGVYFARLRGNGVSEMRSFALIQK